MESPEKGAGTVKQRRKKNLRGLTLAFAVAAIVVPTAQGRIDSRRSQVVPPAASLHSSQAYGVSDPAPIRHADDRSASRGPGIVQARQLPSASDGGFDWSDASVGAGTALAAAIVLSGAALLRRNRQGGVAV
jgi:hypothetical protein